MQFFDRTWPQLKDFKPTKGLAASDVTKRYILGVAKNVTFGESSIKKVDLKYKALL